MIGFRLGTHKTFKHYYKGLAERGKSSMGWFYGFKLHLVCNEKGELLSNKGKCGRQESEAH